MQHWEYRTVFLEARAVSLFKNEGWRIKEINEQEQPDWKKSEVYPSLAEFCNQMGRQNWELISVAYPGRTSFDIILSLKRSIQWNTIEKEKMQHWEYRTVYVLTPNWSKKKEWRIREINEQKQPDWKKSEAYASVAEFCDQMDRQNWELVVVTHPDRDECQVVLYLKRLIQ